MVSVGTSVELASRRWALEGVSEAASLLSLGTFPTDCSSQRPDPWGKVWNPLCQPVPCSQAWAPADPVPLCLVSTRLPGPQDRLSLFRDPSHMYLTGTQYSSTPGRPPPQLLLPWAGHRLGSPSGAEGPWGAGQAVFPVAVACLRAVGARRAGELGAPLCPCFREKGRGTGQTEGSQSCLVQTQQHLALLSGDSSSRRPWVRGREQGCHPPRTQPSSGLRCPVTRQDAQPLVGHRPPLRTVF